MLTGFYRTRSRGGIFKSEWFESESYGMLWCGQVVINQCHKLELNLIGYTLI